LSDFSRICRKYSTNFVGLFTMKTDIGNELEELLAPDTTREKLKKELAAVNEKFVSLHTAVSHEREKLAAVLKKSVSEEMGRLGFNAAEFSVQLNSITPSSHGAENVEFYVSLNPGSPGGPLRRIASGGELSRVALSIKKVLARSDALPTLVFDEIDSGIGGKTAEAVAESLRSLGQEKQVLLVTHLHQIAKEGSYHFTVSKKVIDDQTLVQIIPVKGSQRGVEIARMLGQTDEQGLAFARSLLEKNAAL
jgi:DNA repair protein RecN (Recombination protein N)